MYIQNIFKLSAVSLLALTVSGGNMQIAAQQWQPSMTLQGDAGLVDMPSANGFSDGMLAASVSHIGADNRIALAFQATPNLTAALRYTLSNDDAVTANVDLRYRLIDENGALPAVAIGARNLGGGLDSAEYVVASKSFGGRLNVTAGLGWGRMATRGALSDSLRQAEPVSVLNLSPMFQGSAAPFAGIEYAVNDSWRVKAEYSSDAYLSEVASGDMKGTSPISLGVAYSPSRHWQINGYVVQGRDIGFTATLFADPNRAYALNGAEPAPLPVAANPQVAASWGARVDDTTAQLLASAMANEGLELRAVELRGDAMRLRYENTRYGSEAQGMGRLARVLSHVAPADVRRFQLEPVRLGVAKSQVELQRADLVALENELGAAERLWERAQIGTASSDAGMTQLDDANNKFGWAIGPYFKLSRGDGDGETQYQVGLEANFRYDFRPNMFVSGAVRQRAVGTIEASTATGENLVRSHARDYLLAKGPQLENLTFNYVGTLAPDVYARLSAGYLERMYGGVSGEVLWKPVDSRFGLGLELTYAAQRNVEGLSFGDYQTTTAFVSAYYEFNDDLIGRIDAGRYLAGDTGATVSLMREFPNGWQVGGYVTMTDMNVGAGQAAHYDKGIVISVPVNWLLGSPTRETRAITLGGSTGESGQRVAGTFNMYDQVRDGHRKDLADSWGRFWK